MSKNNHQELFRQIPKVDKILEEQTLKSLASSPIIKKNIKR